MTTYHYYAMNLGETAVIETGDINVATSANLSLPVELRITDAAATRQQVYQFLRKLADQVAIAQSGGIVPGTLIG